MKIALTVNLDDRYIWAVNIMLLQMFEGRFYGTGFFRADTQHIQV